MLTACYQQSRKEISESTLAMEWTMTHAPTCTCIIFALRNGCTLQLEQILSFSSKHSFQREIDVVFVKMAVFPLTFSETVKYLDMFGCLSVYVCRVQRE